MAPGRVSKLLLTAVAVIALAGAALACDRGRQPPTPTPLAGEDRSTAPTQPTESPAEPPAGETPQLPAADPLGDEIEAMLGQLVEMNEAADPLDDLP